MNWNWLPSWQELIVGLLIGAGVGLVVASLCWIADEAIKRRKEKRE